MNQVNRPITYLFILLLLGCASASPFYTVQTEAPGGIGGTGIIHDQNGIGGTGKKLDEGIGGTGIIAKRNSGIGGTGIVGTITAFGSIWVNKAHIHFNELTPITINQAPATSGQLQLGQVVAVNSVRDGDEFQAKSIDIIHEVAGPISRLSLENRSLVVLNQSIQLNDNAIIFDHKSNSLIPLTQLQRDAFIAVSGLRQENGNIIASRLDIVEQMESLQLIGELEQTNQGQWQINNQAIVIDELLLLDELDKRTLVSGHLEGDIFVAEALGIDSIETILEHVSEVIYDGNVFDMGIEGMDEVHDIMVELESEAYDTSPYYNEQEFFEEGAWEEYNDYDNELGYEDEDFIDESLSIDDFEDGNYSEEDPYEYDEVWDSGD